MNAVANTPIVTVKRRINAPAQRIFDAWLDPAALAEWMRPCSSSTGRSDVKVDAREGGAFEIVMHVPSGPVRHTGVYQSIEAPRRLVFTWNSPSRRAERFAGDGRIPSRRQGHRSRHHARTSARAGSEGAYGRLD